MQLPCGRRLTWVLGCAVIKPIFGAASIGVVRVDSAGKLRDIFLRVQREMASVRIDAGAITQGTADDAVGPLRSSRVIDSGTKVWGQGHHARQTTRWAAVRRVNVCWGVEVVLQGRGDHAERCR